MVDFPVSNSLSLRVVVVRFVEDPPVRLTRIRRQCSDVRYVSRSGVLLR